MPKLRTTANWSSEDTATLISMYQKGATYAEMSNIFGRSTRAVEAHCGRLRGVGIIKTREQKLYTWTPEMYQRLEVMWRDDGLSGQSCAEALGVTRSSVLSAVRRRGLHRDPKAGNRLPGYKNNEAVESKINRLHSNGSSVSDIAHHIKATVRATTAKMLEMGLEPIRNQVLRDPFKVHPMWSMPEDERRQAFYEKFQEGWKGVQARLSADAKERQRA